MITAVAAIQQKDRGLGKDGDLLFHIKDDLKRFKEITEGNIVIMGRKTWESLPENVRPLPNRPNIVITSNADYEAPGAHVVHSFDDAISKAKEVKENDQDIAVIGGARVYEDALPYLDHLYLTLVDSDKEADTFFPSYKDIFRPNKESEWFETKKGTKYQFVTYEPK